MALINGRSLTRALQTFFKENGRYPTLEEFRSMVTGKSTKKTVSLEDKTEENV